MGITGNAVDTSAQATTCHPRGRHYGVWVLMSTLSYSSLSVSSIVPLLITMSPLCLAQTGSTITSAPKTRSKSQATCFALDRSPGSLPRAPRRLGLARRETAFPEVHSTLGICSACEDLSTEAVVESSLSDCGFQNVATYLSSGDDGHCWGANNSQLNTSFSLPCNSD